jgi:hypothetical protein
VIEAGKRLGLHANEARDHHLSEMKNREVSVCKLCANKAPLINAHVIPRSFWEIDAAQPPLRMVTNTVGLFPRRIPIGVYDQTIVCEPCERNFSDYDSYAARLFLNRFNEFEEVHDNNRRLAGYMLDNVDYRCSNYSPLLSFGERRHLHTHFLTAYASTNSKKKRARCSCAGTPAMLQPLRPYSPFGTPLTRSHLSWTRLRNDGTTYGPIGFTSAGLSLTSR